LEPRQFSLPLCIVDGDAPALWMGSDEVIIEPISVPFPIRLKSLAFAVMGYGGCARIGLVDDGGQVLVDELLLTPKEYGSFVDCDISLDPGLYRAVLWAGGPLHLARHKLTSIDPKGLFTPLLASANLTDGVDVAALQASGKGLRLLEHTRVILASWDAECQFP
jgi:hypothetical protein